MLFVSAQVIVMQHKYGRLSSKSEDFFCDGPVSCDPPGLATCVKTALLCIQQLAIEDIAMLPSGGTW